MLEGGEKEASATTMVTATDTSEMIVAFPIKCQQSNKSPEEEEQYKQKCLRLNKLKEEEEARANHFKRASAEQFQGVNRVGGAVKQQNMAPMHPPQAPRKQPQPIPTSRQHSQKPPNPQHHHPTQTRVKQQVSSVGVGEGEREGGRSNSYPQHQSFPHPQHPPSAVIPPSAPEVIFEKE